MIDKAERRLLLKIQKTEITEHEIYKKLSRIEKNTKNKKIFNHISKDELEHYTTWKKYTNRDIKPSKLKIWKYYIISRILGITFGIKLMELGERNSQAKYEKIRLKESLQILRDEEDHEKKLISMIDEERVKYIGSIVLGLNDALVEITGSLAGFTLALQNNQLVIITGLVTGSAAALSMAASEYISKKTDGRKAPLKAAIYTGLAYIIAVTILITPYLLLNNIYAALGLAVINALILISFFSYYIAVIRNMPFTRKFMEIAPITISVTLLTFGIGLIMRLIFKIEI